MSIPIHPDRAKHFLTQGATLVLLNVPEGTEFGIDMMSWTTGPDFKGVKMIPPGLHYVFYSSVNTKTNDSAPRIGFMYNFKQKEFVVKSWDTKSEDFKQNLSDEELERIKSNLCALDKFLGPYPFDIFHLWSSMTDHLTPELAIQLTPTSGYIRSALELQSCSDNDRPKGNPQSKDTSRTSWGGVVGDSLLPNLVPMVGTAPCLTVLPPRYPEECTPAEVTKYSLDSSFALQLLIETYKKPIDIIGELQFSFAIFVIGHSLEGFEHWKKLIDILCTSEEALKTYTVVYIEFLKTLRVQVQQIPNEFLIDIVDGDSYIYAKCRNLFKNILRNEVHVLSTFVDRLMGDMKTLFQYDFNGLLDDDPDDLPVIVDLD